MLEENGLSFLRAGGALVLVLCLMYLVGIIFRKISGQQLQGSPLKKKKRLHVEEVKPLDHRTRLAIIKCDDKEHLVLISQNGHHMVIDKDIESPQPACENSDASAANTNSIELEKKISNTKANNE